MTVSALPRVDTTLAKVLDAVVAVLRQAMNLNSATCFWSLTAEVPTPTPDGIWLSIQPDAGEFDESMMIGGDVSQLTAVSGIVVNIFTTLRLDREGHDDAALFNSDRGLLAGHNSVIQALAGQDLLIDGRPVLREVCYPSSWSAPIALADNVRSISQAFKLSWDWAYQPTQPE